VEERTARARLLVQEELEDGDITRLAQVVLQLQTNLKSAPTVAMAGEERTGLVVRVLLVRMAA
jgi:hypothetical protein